MKILYVCNICSKRKYEDLYDRFGIRPNQQGTKYNRLLMEGMVAEGAEVTCLSSLPTIPAQYERNYLKHSSETENGIRYSYIATCRNRVFRRIMALVSSFFYVLKEEQGTTIVCDVLDSSIMLGSFAAAKIRKIKSLAVVTDISVKSQHYMETSKVHKLVQEKLLRKINQYDGYILLTDYMNEVVNIHHKPYIVMEGHVDPHMSLLSNDLEAKTAPPIVLYAGTIDNKYGIYDFARAFVKSRHKNYEFHIYGDGNDRKRIEEYAKIHNEVVFHGVCPNALVVQREIEASILVNPRPSKYEFTKYSFPSKNMEYMSTGTPVLTTSLPGMPDEYKNYVYIFEDDTEEGYEKTLNSVFDLEQPELHCKGMEAKKFVMEHKTNKEQARKILAFIKTIL